MTSFSRLEIISRVFFSPLNISNGSTRWRYNLSSRFPRIPLRSCSTYCIIRYYFARKISQDRPNRCFTNIYKIVRIIEIQHRRLKKKFQKRRERRIKFYKEFLSSLSGYPLWTMLQISSNFLEWNQSRRISRLMETWVARHGNRAALRKENSVRGEGKKEFSKEFPFENLANGGEKKIWLEHICERIDRSDRVQNIRLTTSRKRSEKKCRFSTTRVHCRPRMYMGQRRSVECSSTDGWPFRAR